MNKMLLVCVCLGLTLAGCGLLRNPATDRVRYQIDTVNFNEFLEYVTVVLARHDLAILPVQDVPAVDTAVDGAPDLDVEPITEIRDE